MAMETSVRNLLQRLQSLEIQIAKAVGKVDKSTEDISRLISFFEKSAFARMFSRLQPVNAEGAGQESEDKKK
jgi:hypothetical protein